MVPLLFICISQCRPLQVNNPIRYNRRSLSQPYPNGSVRRSEAIFHSLHASFLSAIVELTTGTFSVKHPKIYSLRHCISHLSNRMTQIPLVCQCKGLLFGSQLTIFSLSVIGIQQIAFVRQYTVYLQFIFSILTPLS